MSTPFPARSGRPARRRLLQAAAGVAAALPLAACQDGPLRSADEADGEGPAPADPDEALLAEAMRREAELLARLRPLLATGPASVGRTVQVHEAHLALLGQGEEADGDQRARPRLRVGAIAAAEERLGRRHAEAAVRASSGDFARVLAGMAAAAAQQADLWRQGGDGA